MPIFNDRPRRHKGPARHSESTFSFLNRSASEAAGRIRALLEDWLTSYPPSHQFELARRFRSEFDSAFFELFVHEWLRHHGALVDVHPKLHASDHKPDFRVRFPGGGEVIVEAVVATDSDPEDAAQKAVQAIFFDELSKLDSPNFFIGIREISHPPGRQPPARKILAFLKRELRRLDPDALNPALRDNDLLFEDGDFRARITAIPKAKEARGLPGVRPIGIYPGEARWGGVSTSIRSALERKARRYGQLTAPYVIAVNGLSRWGFCRGDVVEALFGSKDACFRQSQPGFWLTNRRATSYRVSAVLAVSVFPWTVARADTCIYHNPFAALPATAVSWGCEQATFSLARSPGRRASDLFELPVGWPGELIEDDG